MWETWCPVIMWCGSCRNQEALAMDYLCARCRGRIWWPGIYVESITRSETFRPSEGTVWMVTVATLTHYGSETYYFSDQENKWLGGDPYRVKHVVREE